MNMPFLTMQALLGTDKRPLRPNLSATSLIRDTKKSMGHGRKVIEKPSLFH